jgi:hypothetical protein
VDRDQAVEALERLRRAAELDSVLHLEQCRHRWRPLRRVALA